MTRRPVRFTPSEETSHDGPGARPVEVYLVNERDSYVVVGLFSPAPLRLVGQKPKLLSVMDNLLSGRCGRTSPKAETELPDPELQLPPFPMSMWECLLAF